MRPSRLGMQDRLVYQPDTLITNSADAAFYRAAGVSGRFAGQGDHAGGDLRDRFPLQRRGNARAWALLDHAQQTAAAAQLFCVSEAAG